MNSIGEELYALKGEDGMIHAEHAHEWAEKHPKSALHGALMWDDKKAGYQFRLMQIRKYINLYVVQEHREPVMVNLTPDRPNGGGYREISDVLKNRRLSEIMLDDALRDLERVQGKYQHLLELASIWKEVDKVRARRDRNKDNNNHSEDRPNP